MKNLIIINNTLYKPVRSLSTGLVVPDACSKCEMKKVCERTNCQYPCDLFKKKDHIVYFKKLGKIKTIKNNEVQSNWQHFQGR